MFHLAPSCVRDLLVLSALLGAFAIPRATAQTTLNPGDIAFTYGQDGSGFAFVLLVNVQSGTVINFDSNSGLGGDTRTWTAECFCSAGTVFTENWGDFKKEGCYAYQGSANCGNVIAEFSLKGWEETGTYTSCNPSGGQSIEFPDVNHRTYTGTRSASKLDLLSALSNTGNWSNGSNNTGSFNVSDATTVISIYAQDFESYADGQSSSGDWITSNAGDAEIFQVYDDDGDKQWRGEDTDDNATWLSAPIDITGYTNLSLSIDLGEEGNIDPSDYIRVSYVLDGVTVQLTQVNNDFNPTTVCGAIPNGSSLRVEVIVDNGNDEVHYFDNILVQGELTCTEVSISAANAAVDLTGTGTVLVDATTVSASSSGDCFNVTGLEVSKDGGSYASSVAYDCTETGANTVYVRATDGGSNVSPATTVTVTVNGEAFSAESSCNTCTSSYFLEGFGGDVDEAPGFTASSTGNNPGSKYWGLWDESEKEAIDFGEEGPVEDGDVPNWLGGFDTLLVARNMDEVGVSTGVILWETIEVSDTDTLVVSLEFAAQVSGQANNPDRAFDAGDGIEVFVRPSYSGCDAPWVSVLERSDSTGLGDGTSLVLSEVSSVFAAGVDEIDMKLEVSGIDAGWKRIAIDNVQLKGFTPCTDTDGDGVCDDDEVDGCTDPAACNYDAAATDDDGSCTFATTWYEDADGDGLGHASVTQSSCDQPAGYVADDSDNCDDLTACNYDDAGNPNCTFPVDVYGVDYVDCDGACLNDADGDGVCDEVEVTGCTDATACNYDATPTTDTDNALCVYASGCDTCSGETDGSGTVVDGDQNGNGICDDLEDGCISTLEGSLATSLSGEESDTLWFAVDSGFASTVFLNLEWVRYSGTSQTEQPADLVVQILDGSGDCVGFGGASGWSLSGCTGLGDGPAVYDGSWTVTGQVVTVQDTIDVSSAGLAGAGDWKVVLTNGNTAAGLVTYTLDVGIASVCGVQKVAGCTDDLACNYDPAAEVDNGSCVFSAGEGGCACEISGTLADTLDYVSPVGTPVQFEANSVDGPQLFTMALDYTNVDVNDLAWPSDMAIRILDPAGNCSWFGGYDFAAADVPGCNADDELTVGWPPSGWNSSQNGSYAAILDLSTSDLTGSGTWSITLLNGWSGVSTGGQTGNEAVFDLDWSLTGLCALGCTDPTACNYDANAVVDNGSCAYPELPDPSTFDLEFELALDTTGIVFLSDFWGQLGVSDVCGAFEVAFVQDSCGTFGTFLPSYSAPGTYDLNAQITAPDTVLSLAVDVVVSQAAYAGCQDLAACNFNQPELGINCIYPGEVGWCENPSGEVGYVLAAAAGGNSCLCQSDPFEVLYFEDFGPGGAANGNGAGYGYQGRLEVLSGSGFDVNTAATETEWSIVLNDPNTGDDVFDGTEADYWTTLFLEPSGFVEDTAFVGKWLFDVYGWNSRQVSLQGHDWVHAHVEVSEDGNMESDDRLDAMVRTELDTTVLGALEGNLASEYPSFTTWSLTWTTSAPSLWFELEAENDAEFEYHLFDDVKLSGWGREGCTDSRATVASYDVAADIDDGSCQYDRDTVFARTTGLHTDRLWGASALATPSRLGGFAQALDSTTSLVVGPQCQVTLDVTGPEGGVVHVDALELRENAAVYLPAGTQLHVHGNFSPAAGRGVYGPGELRLKGGWDWTAVGDSATVSFEDLFLDEGSSLVVPDGSVLEVSGDISFPQTPIQTVSGEVDMNGDADQMVSGGVARFDRLVMNKCVTSARVSFDNTLEVLGRLTLNEGIVDMGSDSLVFRSDAAGTGLLDAIPATAELVGSLANDHPVAKTERYIAPDDDGVTFWGYTLFAGSGVEGMTVSDLNGIDGFYSAGWSSSDYPDATSTVLFWDEGTGQIVGPNGDNTPLDTLGGCWITLLGTQTPIMSARGALRDHRENEETRYAISRTTVEEGVFNGYLQTSNVYSGWNLVPNPYQARLDWNVLFSKNADLIEDQYAIFNTQTKQFQYWSSQLDSLQINGSRYIEPGNAFWVRLKEGLTADSLVIPVSAIDNVPAGDGFVRSEEEEAILLEVENAFGRSYVQVRRSEAGSTDYLHGPDISFITSSSVNHAEIAVATGGALFASKVLPEEASAMLFVKSISDWPTTLRVVRAPEGLCGRVVDTETGVSLTLTEGEQMTFTLPQQVAEAGRFMLEVRPWAEAEGRMPSCPDALDGEIEVEFGEGVTAHVALTTPEGIILDQHMSAIESTSFSVAPGDYQVVVTPVAGTFCPKRHREVVVPPGEEPELLGLDWSAPLCNEGTAEVAFELYGGGTFGWTLWTAEGNVAEQGAGHGEVALTGLQPGHYVLDVDHPCLSESRDVSALDAEAPVAEADFLDVIVQPSDGEAVTWSALCTTPNVTGCAWWVDGVLVSEEPALDWSTTELGLHTVWLRVERDGCSHEAALTFEVVPTMKGEMNVSWSVTPMSGHWLVHWAEGDDLIGRWQLRDGRGRLIQTGAVPADASFRVPYPATQGVYFLSLSVSDFTDVKCVFAP